MANFLFPFDKIPKSSNIVLYGAGGCGKQFYKQINESGYCNIVLWVDKRAGELRHSYDYPVSPLSDIANKEFEYLVIAIADRNVADEAASELISNYHIDKEKVVCTVHELPADRLYKNQQAEYKSRLADSDELMEIAPIEFVNSMRLDTMVRYLLCRDIIHGIENHAHLSLYSRMILCRGNRREGVHYFQEKARVQSKDFISEVKKICSSMKQEGFIKRYYIPMAAENKITLNGQHRLAAALAAEKNIWVRYYPKQKANEDMGLDWFTENGFGTYDKLEILRAFADLYPDCVIAILYGPSKDNWEYIVKQMKRQMTVVGCVDLDFSNNYIAFENLLHEIYSDPLWHNIYMDRKLDLLTFAPLQVRVVLLSDENNKGVDLFDILKTLKLNLRDHLYFDLHDAPIVMHSSDSREEFERLKQIVLSANNLRSLRKRVSRNYSEEFISRLDKVKDLLDKNHIKHSDVIIVGSSALEIHGLRKAVDIDVAVKSSYRNKFGYETYSWGDGIDYTRVDSVADEQGTIYSDDLLIDDDNLHFVFYGLKIINLELIKLKKKRDRRDKDLNDIKLIEVFEDFSMNFDDKHVLQQQIDKQIHQRRFGY